MHARRRPVLAPERRLGGDRPLDEPGDPEDGVHRVVRQDLVLGRERVDRGHHDDGTSRIELGPGEARPRHDVAIRRADVREQECARGAGEIAVAVGADVQPPHDRHAGAREARRHPGRLGVVEDHRVIRPQPRQQRLGAGRRDGLVVGVLVRAERPAVAGGAVEPVVQALRDGEEGGIAVQDAPAGVDAGPAGVREQRTQHLGHASAMGGGVDAPDRAAGEQPVGALAHREQRRIAGRVEHVAEALGGQRPHGRRRRAGACLRR